LRRISKFHGAESVASRIFWLESFRTEAVAVVRSVGRDAPILNTLGASADGPVRRQTGIAYLVK
jgi:hypothetical protein